MSGKGPKGARGYGVTSAAEKLEVKMWQRVLGLFLGVVNWQYGTCQIMHFLLPSHYDQLLHGCLLLQNGIVSFSKKKPSKTWAASLHQLVPWVGLACSPWPSSSILVGCPASSKLGYCWRRFGDSSGCVPCVSSCITLNFWWIMRGNTCTPLIFIYGC